MKDGNVVSNLRSASVGKKETEDCWSLFSYLGTLLKSEAIQYITAPVRPTEYVNKVVSGLERGKARELEQEWKGFASVCLVVYVMWMTLAG